MTEWWRTTTPWIKRLTVLATACTATIAAVTAAAHVFEIAEPYWIATRGQVRHELLHTTEQLTGLRAEQITTQLAIARNERARVLDKIADRELLLQQTPDIPAPAKSAIDEQIRSWRDDVTELNYSIDQLTRQRSGRRP